MFDFLQSVDATTQTISLSFQTPILTHFFQFLSGIGTWGLVWIIIAVALFFFEEVEDRQIFGALFLSLGMILVGVEWGIKNLIQRARPDPALFQTYSFPSTHAVIAFAAAYILSFKHPKFQFIYYVLASCIALSRIYLGQHYFTDVAGGAIIGIAIGWVSLKIVHWKKITKK